MVFKEINGWRKNMERKELNEMVDVDTLDLSDLYELSSEDGFYVGLEFIGSGSWEENASVEETWRFLECSKLLVNLKDLAEEKMFENRREEEVSLLKDDEGGLFFNCMRIEEDEHPLTGISLFQGNDDEVLFCITMRFNGEEFTMKVVEPGFVVTRNGDEISGAYVNGKFEGVTGIPQGVEIEKRLVMVDFDGILSYVEW